MANKKIIDYFREGLRRGFSAGLLKKKLLEAKFKEADIDEALKSLDKKPGFFKKWFFLVIIILIFLIILSIFFVFMSGNTGQEINKSSSNIICDEEQVRTRALEFLNAIKSGDFNKYQIECGFSDLCQRPEVFYELNMKLSQISTLSIKEIKENDSVISVYLNERIMISGLNEQGEPNQFIVLSYNKEDCKLISFFGDNG